jgi:hypothetical protein
VAANHGAGWGGGVMASVNLTYEIRISFAMTALANAADDWSTTNRARFKAEWDSLVLHGAETIDCQFIGGRLVAHPSEDFTLHLEKWGVYL